MDQVFEGEPQAEIRLEGQQLIRGEVTNDWGSLLQWQIKKDGQQVATVPARMELAYQPADLEPGKYEAVLQMWKYVDYKKDKDGEFVNSKFVDISNAVTFTV